MKGFQNELVSIIVPVYNAELFLPRCIDSILSQTYKNIELILVDDGSADGSPRICDEYAKEDSRIHVIHKKNGGVSSARNAALDYLFDARSNNLNGYIMFVDSDDWIHLQCVEALVRSAYISKASVVCNSLFQVYEYDKNNHADDNVDIDKLEVKKLSPRELTHYGIDFGYIIGCLYERKQLKALRFNESIRIAEDALLWFDFMSIKENFEKGAIVVNNKLYYYYQRADSAMHSADNTSMLPAIDFMIEKMLCTHNDIYINNFLDYAKRWLLYMRYYAKLVHDKKIKRICNDKLKKCISLMKRKKNFSFKDDLCFLAFVCFPLSYRLFRLLTDKTIWAWEKKVRKEFKV